MRKQSRNIAVALAAVLALGVSACSKNEPAAPPPPAPERQVPTQQERQPAAGEQAEPEAEAGGEQAAAGGGAAAEEAQQIYSSRCLACHGAKGVGDGAAAAALNPKPRSFADKEWQSSVTDQHIETVILKGGPAVGQSPLMPGNPDLEGKPEVVAELRKMVREFGK